VSRGAPRLALAAAAALLAPGFGPARAAPPVEPVCAANTEAMTAIGAALNKKNITIIVRKIKKINKYKITFV
jgi:hypothetical protein